jgi:hypothetical protein|tara:strand:- start:334 stop:786 length:453 start_codon:yes stop_codon:yes gene_type:complete
MSRTHTPLLSEVLKKVHNAKTKDKKISILRENDSDPLRMVIKSSFDPNIEWVFPEGEVPYKKNDVPEGTEHTVLRKECRKLFRFIKGGDNTIPQFRKENLFIQMLEGLHESEAQLIIDAKDKKLHQVYKGLSDNVVKEAFGWNDQYIKET